MKPLDAPRATLQIPLVLGLLALLSGFVVTLVFLGGDDEGRVNLLFLLLLFVFVPLAGLVLSVLLLFFNTGQGLANWLLTLPFWPLRWHQTLVHTENAPMRRAWLFYVSQLVGFCLGIGGVLAFMVILLGSDVSFVWRSTLLQAQDLAPLLSLLALPWQFWPEAQPTLALLQMTQDFRLGEQSNDARVLGQWWRFALAAQCTFNLLPRGVLLVIAQLLYRRSSRRRSAPLARSGPVVSGSGRSGMPAVGQLARVVHDIGLPYQLINWGMAPDPCLDYVATHLGQPLLSLGRGAAAAPDASLAMVVLVKGWEPPLGELQDYLQSLVTGSYLLPVDWDESGVRRLTDVHLEEWRRFAGQLDGWSVLQPEDNT